MSWGFFYIVIQLLEYRMWILLISTHMFRAVSSPARVLWSHKPRWSRPVAASHASISAAALCTDSIRP